MSVSTRAAAALAAHRTGQLPTALVCAGCGYRPAWDEPLTLRCPRARPGDDVDHLLHRELDPTRLIFPTDDAPNPFVRYRTMLHGYHVARARGSTEAEVVAAIEQLDAQVAAVDGRGFGVTPLFRSEALSERLGFKPPGGVLVKDETGNVSGSHKARHLFGTMLDLLLTGSDPGARLAIASCGNAALAAAVVARAAGRRLQVFIPVDAHPVVVTRLEELGAELTVCERTPGMTGDPTWHRLNQALADGAIPFTCQGPLNGLAIEGGATLGYELATALSAGKQRLDRLIVQVGGGALASSCWQALSEAHALHALPQLARLDTVQTHGAHPLERAYDLVAARLLERLAPDDPSQETAAERLQWAMATPAAARELAEIARQRSAFMWPWETEPHSLATGILDDETYDWLAVVRGMLESGGSPLIVDEATLAEANALARDATGIDVDPTGSAGLAGLLELRRQGQVRPDETVAVIFSGVRRTRDE